MHATSLSRVPHLDQWFGVWAMEEGRFWAGYEFLRTFDLHLHLESGAVQATQQAANAKQFEQRGSVALIGIHGRMMKHASSLNDGTSTVQARRQVRAAAADPEISAILLHIDSPGGTAAGTADLAADIGAAGQQKPVWAFVEDLGASAAYWVASQAHRVSANPTALVGSIGTYGVVYDYSGAAAMEGVKAHVVRAGKFKGMGTPGTEVTQEHLQEMQRSVDALNAYFLNAVASGRKMSAEAVAELADGRVHIARDAKRLNLIDAVESFDATFTRLERESRRKPMTMAEHVIPESSIDVTTQADQRQVAIPVATVSAAVVATYDEIKSGCLGADAAFICSQLEARATLAQAQSAWMAEQNRRVQEANERAQQAAAAAKRPGVEPVTATSKSGPDISGDPIEAFEEAVTAEAQRTGKPRADAHKAVCKKQPELREAYIAAWNERYQPVRKAK